MDAKIIDDLRRQTDHLTKIQVNLRLQVDPDAAVKTWLDLADNLAASLEKFVRDYEEEDTNRRSGSHEKIKRRVFPKWRSKFWLQANEILERAIRLCKQGDDMLINVPGVVPMEEAMLDVGGVKKSVEEIFHHLMEEGISTVGIYGTAGSGKTTVLISSNNHATNFLDRFDLVIFVTVSQRFDVRRVQQEILDRLCLPQQPDENLLIQTTTIFRHLQGKRWLLLLDDVREPLDLSAIGVPDPTLENGCKVVFTTRSKQICGSMGAQWVFTTKLLSDDESWLLFCSEVGPELVLSSPDLTGLAREIVRKCQGLPLAVITIGRQLVGERDVCRWEHVLGALKRAGAGIPESLLPLFILVGYSYEMLSTPNLKDCFLYCSLFPEISEEELSCYLVAEGFPGLITAFDCIHELKEKRLLVSGSNHTILEVSMEDINRQFALTKMGNRFLIDKDDKVLQALSCPSTTNWKELERVCLKNSDIESLEKVHCGPKLRTLILKNNVYLRKIPDKFFLSHALRVLNFSLTSIDNIPSSIGSLHQLKHLDLSFTSITSLPKELGQLVNLTHLGLEGTTLLTKIPGGTISGLTNLVVLNMFDSYSNWAVLRKFRDEESSLSMKELEILASKDLEDIGITICSKSAFKWFLKYGRVSKLTHKLILKNCHDLLNFNLSLRLMNIRQLALTDCDSLTEIVIGSTESWGLETQYFRLMSLQLIGLFKAKIIIERRTVSQHCLRDLREIIIDSCYELEDVSWVSQLTRLEHLSLSCCIKMKCVIRDVDYDAWPKRSDAFRKLKTMTLRKLPSLKSICKGIFEFPCLESLKVSECSQLWFLPLGFHGWKNSSANDSLKVISGDREWWDDLYWEDETVRQSFTPYFQEEC